MEVEEWLPLVDCQGNIIGKTLRSQCHKGEKDDYKDDGCTWM